jgi:biotin carboxyl carrier protein
VTSRAVPEPVKLAAKVGGVTRDVEVVETALHHYDVTIDGVRHSVDSMALKSGAFSLLIDHRSYMVDVRSDGDRHRVDLAGRTIDVTLVDTLRHGGVALEEEGDGGPQELRAMMPGKVVTVLVKVGDEVAKDHGILVVEAMKMENELRAPSAGVVKEILVQPGQPVEAGEVLARIE